MFFKENELILELLGVFKITRNQFFHESIDGRAYDCLGFRLDLFSLKCSMFTLPSSLIIFLSALRFTTLIQHFFSRICILK